MNDSQRDNFEKMIRRYEEDMRRYVRQNRDPNADGQFTGNMPSCGSQSAPVNTAINTGTPEKKRRLPDATPPMRIPDASAPVEAAGNPKNHAQNRVFDADGAVEEAVPDAVPPSLMDEELLRMGGWEPASPGEFSDGRSPLTPLYPVENRMTVPSGQRTAAPSTPPEFIERSPASPAAGTRGRAFAPVEAPGNAPQNPGVGGADPTFEQTKAPTSGNTRNSAVPLPLASGNTGIRPSIPAEQSPWGPTSAQPPARSESSEIPARTRAPQYADLTATDANTPTSHPLPRNPRERQNEISLREQNIADRASKNVSNPGVEQNVRTASPSEGAEPFTAPSSFRSGNEDFGISTDGAAVSPQLMRDLEAASQLLAQEGASGPGIENFRNSELMSRLSATGMVRPDSADFRRQEDNMEALSAPLPPAGRPQASVSGQESTVQPNGVYQTESEYPVREQEDWESDEATITIYAYTARQGLPVPDADVTVSRVFEGRSVLHFFTTTGISGETVPRAVPAPPREWTQAPGYEHPYASYSIQVDAPGYYTVENINVPVFGGEASIQPVEMIPIPENEKFIREKVVRESGPAEL